MKKQKEHQKTSGKNQQMPQTGYTNNGSGGRGNDPHADRSAKTDRKGAGEQQRSGASPMNS
jgi:hypothetical protein